MMQANIIALPVVRLTHFVKWKTQKFPNFRISKLWLSVEPAL